MKKHKGKILVLFLAVLLVSLLSCENPFLKKMLVEEEKGNTVPEKPQPQEPANPENPAVPVPKYTVSFSVEGAGGTLKARADGIAETGVSPITVEQGKTVTFTAEPAAGYVVKEWKVDGAVVTDNTSNSYTHTVTAAVDVKVSFDAPFVEGGASLILSPDKLDIKVKVRTADGTPVTVEGCEETTLASGGTVLHAKGTTVILKGKITELYCGDYINGIRNKLTALNVQGLTALQRLVCGGNQLTTLDVQGCTALKELDCHYNQLTALDVQGLNALQDLRCFHNQLTALNVQGLTALQWLYCYDNQLTALDVQSLTALGVLYCSGNQLTALNVQDLTALQLLWCSHNQLTALNVQGLSNLQILDCRVNQLTALDVQDCTALKELDCSGNQLTALDVQGCTALYRLYCWGNRLNDQTFIKIFNDLPKWDSGDDKWCILYTEETGVTEGNHTDFTSPAELKAAFENAKYVKRWRMCKYNTNGSLGWIEI